MKECSTCRRTLPLTSFYKDRSRLDGRTRLCKECSKAGNAKWHREKRDQRRSNDIKRKYGITSDDYNELLEKQGHKCAICNGDNKHCGSGDKFHIDHCHTSGKVRGLLCGHCNRGLGLFNDNPAVMLAAINYIKENM